MASSPEATRDCQLEYYDMLYILFLTHT